MQGRSKRHHFLPQSYLRAWANDRDQVLVRRRDRDVSFTTSIINVAVQANLYSMPGEDGPDDRIERELARIEGPLATLLDQVRNHRTPRPGSQERSHLSDLIALQIVRTPEYFDFWTMAGRVAEFTGERPVSLAGVRRFLTEAYLVDPPSDGEVQGASDFVNVALLQDLPEKSEMFDVMFRIAREEIAPRLEQKAWAVERTSGPPFVTTDRPVSVWRRDPAAMSRIGAGIESADEIRFPLGPRQLLVMRPRFPENRTFVDAARVASVNRSLAAQSHAMVMGLVEAAGVLDGLALRRARPSLRFNAGPLVAEQANGRSLATGSSVVHLYVSYGDEAVAG